MAQVGAKLTPEEAMRLAVVEAQNGRGFVSPNPLVGCTIVDRDHKLLAVGYHPRVGQHHAEIDALNKVSDKTKLDGATVYVTLEPCAHEGRTGSCAKALANLPVNRVVFGLVDPFPLVAGKGAKILRDAGIEAVSASDSPELSGNSNLLNDLEDLAEVFLHNVRTSEPFVALKVAVSSDGMIGVKNGGQVWVTGEESRAHVQWLRLGYDAVLIGRGTFEADNPSLNIRMPDREVPKNKVVLLDPSGKSLTHLDESNLLKVRPRENVFVLVRDGFSGSNPSGVQILNLPTSENGEFSATDVLKTLWHVGIRSIFVEGGAQTYASFLRERKVQRLYRFVSPKILGKDGIPWRTEDVLEPQLTHSSVQEFGDDKFESARVKS